MQLNEVFTLIAAQIKCDASELIAYAAEDDLGGYHINEMQRKFPQGSAWAVELQTLYALIRHFKPEVIAEIGGWLGASASHMALACKRNGIGHVTSVDNGVGGQPHGALIPNELRPFVTLVNDDGRVWLAAQPPQSIGLLFEDADHSTQLVMELTRLALSKIEAGGILATHDAHHDFAYVGGGVKIDSSVGREVREGLARAGAYSTAYLADPSDCGLALTVIPGVKQTKLAHDHLAALSQVAGDRIGSMVGNANIESQSEPPKLAVFKGIEDIEVGFVPMSSKGVQPTDADFLADDGNQHKEAPVKKPRGKGRKKAAE